MVCYIVPTTAAIVHFFARKKFPRLGNSRYHSWLSQLFLGGAVFGIVDHWWNRELFLIGKNILSDLALGVTITLVIVIVWAIMVAYDKAALKDKTKAVN